MASVLLTGGAGYLGSVITEYLLGHGHEVTVLDNLCYGQNPLLHLVHDKHFDFIKSDARDTRLLSRILPKFDFILPLAGIVGAPAAEKNPELAKSVNYGAIAKLLSLRERRQKIIFPNTNSGYGVKRQGEICTEKSRLAPISLYGRTKVQAERLLISQQNTISLRLATVFGVSPRMRLDLLVNNFTYRALKDRYLVIFEKQFKRNYIHIRDVARCFLHCISNFETMKDEVYNVGLDDANLSKEELALLIREHVPDLKLVFSDVGKDIDKRNYIVSNKKIGRTGFHCKYSLDDGIRELVKAYEFLRIDEFVNA